MMPPDVQQYAVRNESGEVFPMSQEQARRLANADPEALTLVSRPVLDWAPVPPPTDRKLVQVNHIASLDLLELPNGILPATVRNLRRKIERYAQTENLRLDSNLDLLLTVQGYATPSGV